MTFKQQFGANLKRLRESADLSQEQLMWISGVHRTQISNYERGNNEPQVEALARLSRGLGVSIEEFLTGIDWPARAATAADCGRSSKGI